MPLLAQMLLTITSGLMSVFGVYLGARAALIAATITTMAGFTVTLYGFVGGVVAGILPTFPGGAELATGVWLMLPDNAPVCVAAMVAVDAACAVYARQQGAIKLAGQMA